MKIASNLRMHVWYGSRGAFYLSAGQRSENLPGDYLRSLAGKFGLTRDFLLNFTSVLKYVFE
jgi:hypothetical protein